MLRRRDHGHLRHRFCRHVTKIHQRPTGKADGFEPGLQRLIGVEFRRAFIPGDPKIGRAHHDNRHAVVDHRDLDAFDDIHGIARRQQGSAHGTGHIVEDQRHRCRTAGNTVDLLVARI